MATRTELTPSPREGRTERPARTPEARLVVPPVDVYENQDEVLLVADLPGVTRDDLNVRLEDNQLTLEAKRKPSIDGADEGTFRRAFLLPGGIDPDRIAAELKDGVLRLSLPKREALKPRQIAVKSA